MRRYVLIIDHKIHEIREEATALPPFHPTLQWLEVTDRIPAPQEGWSYHATTGVFAAPPPPPPQPVMPDVSGFIADIQTLFTRDRIRQWLDPLMVITFLRGGFADLKLDLDAVKAANKVTQAEYDRIVLAAQNRHLPGW